MLLLCTYTCTACPQATEVDGLGCRAGEPWERRDYAVAANRCSASFWGDEDVLKSMTTAQPCEKIINHCFLTSRNVFFVK